MVFDISKYLKPKKEEEEEIEKFNEIEFQKTYREMATKMGLNLDPDNTLHYYDWRALYKETGSLTPDETGHFPSKYKLEGHPDMVVGGINTKTGKAVSGGGGSAGAIPAEEKKFELNKYIIPKGEVKGTEKEEADPFDTLNESIEKNYKQYQNLTKRLETYEAEYNYAPDNIKPSIAANFNKLVKEQSELVKQLQSDIKERDLMISTKYKDIFMKFKQPTGLPGEPTFKSTPEIETKPIETQFGIGAKAETDVSLAKPEEDFSKPLTRIKYYESKINWLEGIAKEKGYLGESGQDAYKYSIEQYNKAVNEYNKNIEIEKEILKPEHKISPYSAKLIAEQLKSKTYIPAVAEEIKRGNVFAGTVATFGMMLTKIPKQVAVGVLQASQGKEGASVVNRDWADQYIKSASEDIEGFVKEAKAKYGNKAFMGLKISDLAELPQNMGYSLTSMGGGLAVGLPIGLVPLPGFRVAGYILGTAASGKLAYNATTYQIMQQYLDVKNEESIANTGKAITLEEENRLKKEFDRLAHQYGLWEAVPEAISNLAFFSILTAPLTKMVGKTIAGQIVTKLTGLYGEELLTETITQMGQARVEAKVGMREGTREWLSAKDWIKSLKEVAPQTFLLTTLMTGAGTTIIKTKEMFSKAENSLKNEVGEDHPFYNKLLEAMRIQLENLDYIPREEVAVLAYETKEPIIPEEFERPAVEEEVTVSLEEEGRVEVIWAGEDIRGTPEEMKEGTFKAFEKTSEFLFAKPFTELKKSELNKVLETSKTALPDSTGEYINKIGTPAKGLDLRATADEHARFIFGGFEKGILTDSHLLVLDKEVSKAVLSDLIEKYKKARIKEVQSEEVSYKEAQKIVDKEVEKHKKEFVKQFPDTEKIVSEEDVKKSTPLYLQGHQITELGPPITILTDGKIQIAVDTNKLAFLNKHFPNAEIKSTGQNKPVLFIEGGKLKAMVMPVTVEKYPFKITGEPTIRKPAEKVEPTIISKVGPTVRPTKPKTYDIKADLTPEQRVEGNKLIGRIHKILGQKGLTKVEFVSLKKKYGLSPHLATDTRRMTMPQLQAVLKAMERARPKRIGYQKVITRKTEGKIQSLKDSLIEKYQMTEKTYKDTLKDLGIYKEPRYIDGKHFITEEKGKELIYRLIDESNILKITEPLRVALEKNPEIKKLADIIDKRVKLEGERTLKDPSDLNSARSYFQILGTISGAPFFTLYQDLINCHLENRADLNHLIEGFDEYRDIIKEEKELKKVEDWILSKSNLKDKPKTPVDMTSKEIELAKKIEGILKDYQSRARTEKFLDNLEHLEKMPDYLKYKKEIDKAKDIYESKGYDALVKYMKDQEFGIIKSGYDPLQVVSARIRVWKAKGLSIIFGKEHIKVRKDIEYKEQETNIITRVVAYKRQMDNLSIMAPKVRALITLANKNLSKFKNPSRVKSNLQVFFRELKGYDRSTGWFERGINRLYAQAMTTIIMGSPPLAFRNLGQNFGLGHDKAMLVDPRNKNLTPDEIVYLDTYVQQAIFMRTDWFMTGEKPLGFRIGKVQIGLERLTNLIKKINLYPRSDVANRHWGFWGKINQVRMAFEADISLAEKMKKAKFSDFSLLEQKRALEILAKDGQKAMEKYVAKIYVDDVHFLYERAQRSLAEMGPYGKVFGNLMLFPRAYWEKLVKMSKKMTGKSVPFGERARAFKVISSILIGGALVGVAYTKTTGRRKPPYDPLVLLAYQTGGLMIGTVEALNDVYVETINAVRGDRRALATLTSSVPALADHLIPFYNYALRGYEAFLGDPLVNKNIDVYALKKLRQLVDKEYQIRGGVHSVERNAIEKWQYFLSGAGVDVAIKEREKKEKEEKKKGIFPTKIKFPTKTMPTKIKFPTGP